MPSKSYLLHVQLSLSQTFYEKSIYIPKKTLYMDMKTFCFVFPGNATGRKSSPGNQSSFSTSFWIQGKGIVFQEEIKLPVCSSPYNSPNHGVLERFKSGGDVLCTLKLSCPRVQVPAHDSPLQYTLQETWGACLPKSSVRGGTDDHKYNRNYPGNGLVLTTAGLGIS